MRRGLATAILVVAGCGGAAPRPAPAAAAEAPAVVAKPAIVVALPPGAADRAAWPQLSAALDKALAAATVERGEVRLSKVPLDVVQLSIECVEPSAGCYAAAARSLEADFLLFGGIEGPATGKVRVRVVRTDRDGAVASHAEGSYDTVAAAIAGTDELVARAIGPAR
jgi:hypothetical protein